MKLASSTQIVLLAKFVIFNHVNWILVYVIPEKEEIKVDTEKIGVLQKMYYYPYP